MLSASDSFAPTATPDAMLALDAPTPLNHQGVLAALIPWGTVAPLSRLHFAKFEEYR
jgi:hypothetical protein